MAIDFGKIQDAIGQLETMVSRAKGELREASFSEEWIKVVVLAGSILDHVDAGKMPDMDEPPKVEPEPEPVKPPRKPAHK